MQDFKEIWRINRGFLNGTVLFLGLTLIFLLATSQGQGFLTLTVYHHPFFDRFFIYLTNLGDGLFSVAVGILLLALRRWKAAVQVLVAYSISGLLSQLLKSLIYSPRPKDFFAGGSPIHILDGITLSGGASFPSGHTTSAFALATSLALCSIDKKYSWIFLWLAVAVGYSRIYLSNHFPKDVFAGALLGFGVALLVFRGVERIFSRTARKTPADLIRDATQDLNPPKHD